MALIVKVIIVLFFISIFFSLGSALYFLIRGRGNSTQIVKALTWRITLSVVLFLLLMFSFAMGWMAPHPVGG